MTSKQKELYELLKKEITLLDLAKHFNLTPKQAYNRVQTLKNQGYNIYRKDFSTGDIQFSIENCYKPTENILYTLPNINELRFLVLSDTHIGNSLQRLDVLDEAYNYCVKNNIHTIFNCGDLLNGLLENCGHGTLIKNDYEKQINMFLKSYPFDPSIINFTLLGNHDKDFYNGGIELKQILNKNRFDIKVLGYQNHNIYIKNDKITLIHPLTKIPNWTINDKIVFKGHSHESKVKALKNFKGCVSYVPTCSNMFYKDNYAFPGMYDVSVSFNSNGVINKIIINSLIYVDRFVKVGEYIHNFSTPEQYNSINFEETPKKLILSR